MKARNIKSKYVDHKLNEERFAGIVDRVARKIYKVVVIYSNFDDEPEIQKDRWREAAVQAMNEC